jgi:hypothetical protein
MDGDRLRHRLHRGPRNQLHRTDPSLAHQTLTPSAPGMPGTGKSCRVSYPLVDEVFVPVGFA